MVFGKGIGFPAMPYELTDLSAVQRTFYDVNEKYFALLRDIPGEVFLLADDIAADAQDELDCSLSRPSQFCHSALPGRHCPPDTACL